MVGYAVTKYPDLFACAIELFGVVDRATFNERTNRNSAIRWMMKMGGSPEEKPEVYRKANTLADVAKIKTPLLVMHGENDPQVPPYESAQFVRALKEHGKVVYYFTYPNELHGFSQREHRLDAWRRQLAFLREVYSSAVWGEQHVDGGFAGAAGAGRGRGNSRIQRNEACGAEARRGIADPPSQAAAAIRRRCCGRSRLRSWLASRGILF